MNLLNIFLLQDNFKLFTQEYHKLYYFYFLDNM